MADKQSTTYIPGGGPEAASANQAYEDALQQMLESLDARKNRLFEPTLLAIAAGSARSSLVGPAWPAPHRVSAPAARTEKSAPGCPRG